MKLWAWLKELVFGVDEWSKRKSPRPGDWNEHSHNIRLVKIIGEEKARAIRAADERSKDRYDLIDMQIEKLQELRARIGKDE